MPRPKCSTAPAQVVYFTAAEQQQQQQQQQAVQGSAHLVQVRLHELEDHEDVPELPGAGRQHDVLDLHDICATAGLDFSGRRAHS